MSIPRPRRPFRAQPPSPPWPPEVDTIVPGRCWALRDPATGCACLAVEGDTGLVLINTGVDAGAGQAIAEIVPLLSAKPVCAIVYPRASMRHCLGTAAIVPPAEVSTGTVVVVGLPAWGTDGLTTAWPPPPSSADPGPPPVPPNLLLHGESRLRLGGLQLRLLPVDEQALAVHLPEHRLVFLGEPGPQPLRWVAAVDLLLATRIEHLVGTHLPLLSGAARTKEMLTLWRDSVQHRHDQAVRRVLDGAWPEDNATPLPELAEFPALRPWLGAARSSCQEAVASPTAAAVTAASRAPRTVRAQQVLRLAGGRDPVLAEARRRLDAADPQGAAELVADVVLLDPADAEARRLWGVALCDLADGEPDPGRQRHYRTAAATLDEAADPATARRQAASRLRGRPPGALMELLRYRLDPDRATGARTRLRCRITDTGEQFELELRNKVLLVRRSPPIRPADATIVLGSAALVEYVAGAADLPDLLVRHEVTVDGRPEAAVAFFAAFDREIHTPAGAIRDGDQPCAPR
ncbi:MULTISPECIES: alkyl sulfatase C-terminal domain-containing protein [unclassified Crossiella]|uniref:alkyl sulfatase C-terminal domain-containing protein n=1 Tax=unclassified Crossiella TaxID=2620835 RepID=UPI0020000E69|nr:MULTISPECIES: alkyl sulfatase C-terminal domain-containing protein [unclassified Crossiella]MCK2244387.1 hypothetical protein [Crossiella sp. S99.2]MCK2257785.1 hypothetical protein [Crossiella sp. S99.1]